MIYAVDEKQAFEVAENDTIVQVAQYMRDQHTNPVPVDGTSDFFLQLTMPVRGAPLYEIQAYQSDLVKEHGPEGYKSVMATDPDAPYDVPFDENQVLEEFYPILLEYGVSPWALEYQEGGLDPAFINAYQELVQPHWEKSLLALNLAEARVSDSAIDDASETLYSVGTEAAMQEMGFSLSDAEHYEEAIIAESAMFLNMAPDQRAKYAVANSRSEQYDILLTDKQGKEEFFDSVPAERVIEFAENELNTRSAWEGKDSVFGVSKAFGGGADRTHEEFNAELVSAYEGYSASLFDEGREPLNEFELAFEANTNYYDFPEIDKVVDPVIRLYTGILGRSPDRDGAEYWVEQSNKGQSLEDLAYGFLQSSEFQSSITEPGVEGVIKALYENVLGRELDQDGYDYWIDKIESGSINEPQMAISFTNSDEYVEKSAALTQASKISLWGVNMEGIDVEQMGFDIGGAASWSQAETIARVYTGVLGRDPDKEGFDYWLEKAGEGESLTALAESFFHSDEFLGDLSSPTNEQALEALYVNVLDREPDGDGYDYWLSELESGMSFGEAAISFVESDEYVESVEGRVDAVVDSMFNHGVQGVQVELSDYLL